MVASSSSNLDRILDPLTDSLSPAAAESILSFRIDEKTQAEIKALAEKANEGTLTESERADYLDFVESMDLVGILQSKARRALQRRI